VALEGLDTSTARLRSLRGLAGRRPPAARRRVIAPRWQWREARAGSCRLV